MIWLTLNEAVLYFSNRPFASSWIEASNDLKTKCLSWSEIILDSAFTWSHNAFNIDISGNIIAHEKIKNAVCEQALWLLEKNNSAEIPFFQKELESVSLNGISVKFSQNINSLTQIDKLLSFSAVLLIGNLGILKKENRENGTILSSMLER